MANISQFSQAIQHIKKVEFLSDMKTGVGTRFRETRIVRGKESVTELEVTEYVKNDRIRLVADSHGTIWDTLFVVKADNDQTELTMTMEARSDKLIHRLINQLMKGMIANVIAKDLDYVKEFCEK